MKERKKESWFGWHDLSGDFSVTEVKLEKTRDKSNSLTQWVRLGRPKYREPCDFCRCIRDHAWPVYSLGLFRERERLGSASGVTVGYCWLLLCTSCLVLIFSGVWFSAKKKKKLIPTGVEEQIEGVMILIIAGAVCTKAGMGYRG